MRLPSHSRTTLSLAAGETTNRSRRWVGFAAHPAGPPLSVTGCTPIGHSKIQRPHSASRPFHLDARRVPLCNLHSAAHPTTASGTRRDSVAQRPDRDRRDVWQGATLQGPPRSLLRATHELRRSLRLVAGIGGSRDGSFCPHRRQHESCHSSPPQHRQRYPFICYPSPRRRPSRLARS
jgi:hypothetical protein